MGVTDCVFYSVINKCYLLLTLHFGFHLFSLLLHYCAISTNQHAWLAALIYCHQIAIEQSHQTLKYSGFWLFPSIFITSTAHTAALHTYSSTAQKSSTTKWGRNVLTAWRGGPRVPKHRRTFAAKFYPHFIGIKIDLGPNRAGAQVHGWIPSLLRFTTNR